MKSCAIMALRGSTMLNAIEEGAAWYATRAEVQAHLNAGRVIYWRGKYRLTDMGRASGSNLCR